MKKIMLALAFLCLPAYAEPLEPIDPGDEELIDILTTMTRHGNKIERLEKDVATLKQIVNGEQQPQQAQSEQPSSSGNSGYRRPSPPNDGLTPMQRSQIEEGKRRRANGWEPRMGGR